LSLIPTPPLTVNAPVVVLVDVTPLLIFKLLLIVPPEKALIVAEVTTSAPFKYALSVINNVLALIPPSTAKAFVAVLVVLVV
jgi:hypothetical protein